MAKAIRKRQVNRKSRFICWLLMLVQIGAAVGLILTVYYHLGSATLTQVGNRTTIQKTDCKLSTAKDSSLCVYGFVVGGASFVWTILLGILLLVTCGCCGCGEYMEIFFAMLGVVWWAIPVAVFTYVGLQANKAGIPGKRWRWAAMIFSYIGFMCFVIHLILAMIRSARNAYNKGRASNTTTDVESGKRYNANVANQQAPDGQFISSEQYPQGTA